MRAQKHSSAPASEGKCRPAQAQCHGQPGHGELAQHGDGNHTWRCLQAGPLQHLIPHSSNSISLAFALDQLQALVSAMTSFSFPQVN